SRGRGSRALRPGDEGARPGRVARPLRRGGVLARAGASASHRRALPARRGPPRAGAAGCPDAGRPAVPHGDGRGRRRRGAYARLDGRGRASAYVRRPSRQRARRPRRERYVNREIIEAIKQIEREKGISSETLLVALEDALLAAYKKTPDAAEFARVEIDR